MGKTTLTNMVVIEDPNTGKLLVQDRVKKYIGIAFPGGKVEDNESIYDSAIREIKEETGYDITDLEPRGFIYWDEGNNDKYFTYFYKTTTFSGECINETPEGKVFWVEKEELLSLNLAPNMDRYLPMLFGKGHAECYCSNPKEGKWEMVYRG